ncbi:MAG: glycosyltransferase [Actinobacteria bacterium]|nr:glycosyltransferase [Actinomycetota bacterium]
MDVAVVIPVGSVDDALRRQLAAVVSQTGVVLREVVLSVNTATPEVVAAVASAVDECNDKRVCIVDSAAVRGAAHARNVGAAATTSAAIAFCDADDLVHDGWLAALVGGLTGFDAVSGAVVDVFPDQRIAHWYPAATSGSLRTFLGRPYLLSGNLAIRRAAFVAVGGFDENLTRCEDIAISWALLRSGHSIGHVDAAVVDYRHRSGVLAMLRQHYSYGRGMSEVLRAFGTPPVVGREGSARLGILRPNNQHVSRTSVGGVLRRGSIAIGRLRGLVRW